MAKRYDFENPNRTSEAISVKEGIEALIRAYQLQGKFDSSRIISIWAKVMGQTIAKSTSDIFINKDKLFVKLSSAPLKHELHMSRSKVVELINEEMEKEAIKEVVFL